MNTKARKKTRYLTEAGLIATLYVTLTLISSAIGLSSGAVQCRLGEALCLLPVLTPAAIPGVTLGCLISNLITTASIFDITIGSAATLIGAAEAYLLRRGRLRYIASAPTVIANAVSVPLILKLMGTPDIVWYSTALAVAAGELISCTVLGGLLLTVCDKSGISRTLTRAEDGKTDDKI